MKRGVRTPLYDAWANMKSRCNNAAVPNFHCYGGRGITVCARWARFAPFEVDMGPHPGKGWSLDRINNNGNYEPNNCRWTDAKTQSRNTRRAKLTAADANTIKARFVSSNKWHPGNTELLMKEFSVSRGMISDIANGRKWL